MKTTYQAIGVMFLLVSSTACGEIIGQLTLSRDRSSGGERFQLVAPLPLQSGWFQGGPFLWNITGATMEPGWDEVVNEDFVTVGGQVVSFCIDPRQAVIGPLDIQLDPTLAPGPDLSEDPAAPGPSDPNGAYPMGSNKFDAMTELWAEHFEDAKYGGLAGDAFQLALWEVLFEPFADTTPLSSMTWDVNRNNSADRGDFYIKGYEDSASLYLDAITAKTNSWLAGIDGDYGGHVRPTLWAWASDDNQDHLVQVVAVPEPATLIQFAGLAALLGLAALRRRRLGK